MLVGEQDNLTGKFRAPDLLQVALRNLAAQTLRCAGALRQQAQTGVNIRCAAFVFLAVFQRLSGGGLSGQLETADRAVVLRAQTQAATVTGD